MSAAVFTPQASKAALVLQAIVRATAYADQDCNDIQAASDWLTLIEAATSHAYFLLTDSNLGAAVGGES